MLSACTVAPLRDVELECASLDEPHNGGERVENGIAVRVVTVAQATGRHPRGGIIVEVLVKEGLPWRLCCADAVNPSLACRSSSIRVAQQMRGDLRHVVDDPRLSETC